MKKTDVMAADHPIPIPNGRRLTVEGKVRESLLISHMFEQKPL